MIDYKITNPEQGVYLEDETRFWYRDEDGKVYPVELEYLLPKNNILVDETYSGEGAWGNKVRSQTKMRLPFFPGDVYYNHNSVISEHSFFKGKKIPNQSASLNGATLLWSGSENIAPRVNANVYEFVYEGKVYLIKTVNNGSGSAITADGKHPQRNVRSRLSRIYYPDNISTMLTIADINPENPADMRLLSCLGTLLTTNDVGEIGDNLKKDKPNPLLLGPMNHCEIDLAGAKNWTVGPF